MPLNLGGCATPDICCPTLWDNASAMLEFLYDGISGCFTTDECGITGLDAFVSLGRPAGLLEDYLAVWWSEVGSRFTSTDGRGNAPKIHLPEVQWNVQFSMSGYPTAYEANDHLYMPTAEVLNSAARILYGFAERLWRLCASSDMQSVMKACSRFSPVRMFPALPGSETLGGSAGALIQFTSSIERWS